jgi:hypothetical protein
MRLRELTNPNNYSLPDIKPAYLVRQIERTRPDDPKSCPATSRKTMRPVLPDTK